MVHYAQSEATMRTTIHHHHDPLRRIFSNCNYSITIGEVDYKEMMVVIVNAFMMIIMSDMSPVIIQKR